MFILKFCPWIPYEEHICPDGSIRKIYKNIDKALPLYIQGWDKKINIRGEATLHGKSEINKTDSTRIEGLLVQLNDINSGLMMKFRGAYLAFSADPCGQSDFLSRQVGELNREQDRLLRIKIQIEGLIALLRDVDVSENNFIDLYKKIAGDIGGSAQISEVAKIEIKDSRETAQKWIGSNSQN